MLRELAAEVVVVHDERDDRAVLRPQPRLGVTEGAGLAGAQRAAGIWARGIWGHGLFSSLAPGSPRRWAQLSAEDPDARHDRRGEARDRRAGLDVRFGFDTFG